MVGRISVFLVVTFFFSGCSGLIGMGKDKTYCEEHGFDFSDAGLCGDPMEIYKHRKKIIRRVNHNGGL